MTCEMSDISVSCEPKKSRATIYRSEFVGRLDVGFIRLTATNSWVRYAMYTRVSNSAPSKNLITNVP